MENIFNEFISVHEALPALNHLVEYKSTHGDVRTTRLIMDVNKPFLIWLGLNGDSLRTPKYLTHWRYVVEDKATREKEVEEWVSTQLSE